MSQTQDISRAAYRLERAMDEAYSRYAGASEAERIEGIGTALREALAAEPELMHPVLLRTIAEHYQPVGARRDDPAVAAELAALRSEVERLQQKQQMTVERHETDTAIIEALLGRDAERIMKEALGNIPRVVSVVRLLTTFAVDLAKAFLGAAGKPGDTAVQLDRFTAAVRGELSGSSPAGKLAVLLDEIKHKVGAQLEALPIACNDGARQMLRELDPLALEDQSHESAVRFAGLRPFQFREMWETFQKRHAELMGSEDLYRTYFDGPLQRAVYRIAQKRGESK